MDKGIYSYIYYRDFKTFKTSYLFGFRTEGRHDDILFIFFKIYFRREYRIHNINLNHRGYHVEVNKDLQLSFSNGHITQVSNLIF